MQQNTKREEARAVAKQAANEIDEIQARFKKWALEHTAVNDIAINGKTSMFVMLKPEKYTTKDNVRLIAEKLASAYAHQVGSPYTVCRIYLGKEVYAEGKSTN